MRTQLLRASQAPSAAASSTSHPLPSCSSPRRYISRQLSFNSATYDTHVIDLTDSQTKMYDAAANFWNEMHGCFQTALEMLNVKKHHNNGRLVTVEGKDDDDDDGAKGKKEKKALHPAARVMTHYWSCHQVTPCRLPLSARAPPARLSPC